MPMPFTPSELLQSILIVILFLIGGKIVTIISQRYLARWAKNTKTELDDILVTKIKPPFSYVIWLLGVKVALNPLNLHYAILDRFIDTIIYFVVTYVLIVFADVALKAILERLATKTESTLDDALMPLIRKTINVVIIIVGIVWILNVWSINIAPILASLGIAGLALGFAVKDSLANIFGGISLILDRTIKVGDKVKLESGETGYIVDMGLRSAKLRTFDNELITVPNGQLANSRIQNYGQPDPSARVVVNFGVSYDSDVDTVRKTVHDTIMSIENINKEEKPPEVLFLSMEDFYLKFSARFWVYNHLKVWEKKLEATDKIFAALKEANIDIPFPTQTVHLKK